MGHITSWPKVKMVTSLFQEQEENHIIKPLLIQTLVNDKDCGYLQIQIDNTDGKITSTHFYGLDKKLIH